MSLSGQTKITRWMSCFRFQFRLRTLLILQVIISATLGLWFRPYSIEKRASDVQLEARYRVRREWPGSVVAFGQQSTFHENGKISMRWMQWGGDPGEFDSMSERINREYWLPDGREVDKIGWLTWLAQQIVNH